MQNLITVLVFLSSFVQQISSEISKENSHNFCKEVNSQNISETNAFNYDLYPSSIFYGLSVLASQSISDNNISKCVQQLITVIKAVEKKEIWALKSKKNYESIFSISKN